MGAAFSGWSSKTAALEVLHGIFFAVYRASFLELAANGEALLGDSSVALPVAQELVANGLTGLGEGLAVLWLELLRLSRRRG